MPDFKIGRHGKMLTYSLDDKKGVLLYEYIYECVKKDILSGKIKAGTKLPSKRAFAENLGVSTVTVENAYGQLMAEGYIYSEVKKGYYATDVTGIEEYHSKNTTSPQMAGFARANDAEPQKYSVDLTSNKTDSEMFPFTIWAKLLREVINEKREELMDKAPAGGIFELRRAISEHLMQFRGIEVSPEQIIIGAGTEYLYGLLIQLLGRDKIYAVENPGYRKIYNIYKSNNAECVYIPMDEKGAKVADIERLGADVLHISPSHHFPTGTVMPVDRRYELLKWANSAGGRYIIEDDYDSEFRFSGKPVPAMFGMSANDKVIYMNTFTKSLASTVRISYMVLPFELIERFKENLSFYSCTVSNFEQYVLAEFIEKGYFEKHINRMRNYCRKQRDALIKQISESKIAGITEIKEEDAGLHFLLKTRLDISDEEMIKKAADSGLRISCLSQYYENPKDAPQHTLIINYSGISEAKIPETVRLLCECVG